MGDYDSAIPELVRSLTNGYKERVLYEYTGAALAKSGRAEEAVDVLQQGLEIFPDSINLLHWYAGSMYLTGQFGESIEAYKQILKLEPEDIYAHLGLAKIYLETANILAGKTKIMIVLDLMDSSTPLDVCNSLNSMIISTTDIHLAARVTQYCGQ